MTANFIATGLPVVIVRKKGKITFSLCALELEERCYSDMLLEEAGNQALHGNLQPCLLLT